MLFDNAPVDAIHHWVTLLLCSPGSQGREQLELFISRRRRLDELPLLLRMAARFLFVMVSERWVEALHAANKFLFGSARNAGPVHIAFHGVRERLESHIASPKSFRNIASILPNVRSPSNCLMKMGFTQHPTVLRLVRDFSVTHLNRKGRKEVIRLLYHLDNSTLHQDLPDVDGPDGVFWEHNSAW
jgi:hypothetical protein